MKEQLIQCIYCDGNNGNIIICMVEIGGCKHVYVVDTCIGRVKRIARLSVSALRGIGR